MLTKTKIEGAIADIITEIDKELLLYRGEIRVLTSERKRLMEMFQV